MGGASASSIPEGRRLDTSCCRRRCSARAEDPNHPGPPGRICGAFRTSPVATGTKELLLMDGSCWSLPCAAASGGLSVPVGSLAAFCRSLGNHGVLSPAFTAGLERGSRKRRRLGLGAAPPACSPAPPGRCLEVQFKGSFIASPAGSGPSPRRVAPARVIESCRTFVTAPSGSRWKRGEVARHLAEEPQPTSERLLSLRGRWQRRRRLFVRALNSDRADCTFSGSDDSPAETGFSIAAPIRRGEGRRLMDGGDPGG